MTSSMKYIVLVGAVYIDTILEYATYLAQPS